MEQIHELITRRWSPVAFDPGPIGQDKLRLLFEAAKWAPSARNAQPWRFIYATGEMDDFRVLLELLHETNREWARYAPLLVLSLAQVISTYKNRPNRLALYETGMAVSNLLLQATHMGLFVHQMSGYDRKKAREVLAIPARYEPAAMMAIGFRGRTGLLPPALADRENQERTRMMFDEFVIPGRWDPDRIRS